MGDDLMPIQREHDPYIVAWLLNNPGPQRRKDIVNGAVAIGPWTTEQRAQPSRSKTPGRFASQLHQQAWFRVWPLRAVLEYVEAVGDGMYVLTAAGRRAAESPDFAASAFAAKRVGVAFPEDRPLPDRENATPVVFEYDPDARDRQTRAHEVLVQRLAVAIRKLGYEPLLAVDDGPRYDVAFLKDDGDSVVVIEVKSLSDDHAVHQLRLGLGQVLHYTHQLAHDRQVSPALAVPSPPPAEWASVCATAGVQLIVAPDFADVLSALGSVDE